MKDNRLSRIVDVRGDKKFLLGNIIEVTGDGSMGFFQTDRGYRLILDTYNMTKIAKHLALPMEV